MMTIHAHKSGEMGIFANAYAVETEESLIVIDATLTRSEAAGDRLWIITEADRSATMLLLPEEY
jgi:hypothetical protein